MNENMFNIKHISIFFATKNMKVFCSGCESAAGGGGSEIRSESWQGHHTPGSAGGEPRQQN